METILPKIEYVAEARNYAKFTIGPLERGFGITVGHALRRVLLSSIPGAAVTSIRVSGIYHEFAPIPNVKETMLELILNVKKIRVKIHEGDSAKLRVEVTRAGEITAGDLECPANVEIVNPEQYLLTADSDDVNLEIEMTVQRGKGYSPAEERKRLPPGEIAVDAIFNPVRKVNYTVESTRVGRLTNYDKLTLEIWTDGTIRPEEALRTAAEILVRNFSLLAGVTEMPQVEEVEEEAEEEEIPRHIYEMTIDELGLSTRVYNALRRAGITKVGELLEKMAEGKSALTKIRNFGEKSLAELIQVMDEKGLLPESWKESQEQEGQNEA